MSTGKTWNKLLKAFWGSFQRDARDLSRTSERAGCPQQATVHTENLDFLASIALCNLNTKSLSPIQWRDESRPALFRGFGKQCWGFPERRVSSSPKQRQCPDYPNSCPRLKHITYNGTTSTFSIY